MSQIPANTPYRVRTSDVDARASARTSNLAIDPPHYLASILPATNAAVRVDVERGGLSLLSERRRAAPHTSIRDTQGTLTREVTVRACMAETPDEIAAAKYLVHRRYTWRGYDMPEQEERSLCEAFEPDSNQIVFVATEGNTTVGTVTLGLDNPDGLLAERSYPEEIERARSKGYRLCDVTRLAVSEEADSKRVLAALFSLIFAAASVNDVTHMFIEVNPRHTVFYRRVLGFHLAGGEKFCERVKAPSVLLCVEMDVFERHLMKLNTRFAASREQEARAA